MVSYYSFRYFSCNRFGYYHINTIPRWQGYAFPHKKDEYIMNLYINTIPRRQGYAFPHKMDEYIMNLFIDSSTTIGSDCNA